MTENRQTTRDRISEFRPSKTLWFWSSAAVFIATLVVGFGFGGWVTGSTAQRMADASVKDARAQLVAGICVDRYIRGEELASRMTKFKEANSWDQRKLIEAGKWAEVPGVKDTVANAARLCAEQLAEIDVPAAPAADTTIDEEADKVAG
jgi:alpha/beta superfamily hydrolase